MSRPHEKGDDEAESGGTRSPMFSDVLPATQTPASDGN
jgi:hypothetical protein